jgi:hypothetical protein
VALQDRVAKSRSRLLDARLDRSRRVTGPTVGHVRIGPSDVPVGWGAGRIDHARLAREHERLLGHHPSPRHRFRVRDLLERSGDVHDGRASARRRAPGGRVRQRPVDFESAWSIAEAQQPIRVSTRQPLPGNACEMQRRDVEQILPAGPRAARSSRRSTAGGTGRGAARPSSPSTAPAPAAGARDSGTGARAGRDGAPGRPRRRAG